jgi:tetratricopeptide (TPR) repeat protein
VNLAPGLLALRPRRAGVFATLMLLSGCAAPVAGPPPLLRAAAGQTRAGQEAYLTGRARESLPPLTEAVRLHLAAGDLPGAARALLNLALAQRAAGDTQAAAASAARLRDLTPAALQQAAEGAGKEGPDLGLSIAPIWLDALLADDRGDFPAAAGLLGSVTDKLPASSPWTGRLETLRAALALGEDHPAEALIHARAGQTACAAAKDQAEEARAWRLAGTAQMRLGQWPGARADFLASLKIEETLGAGARMAGDLRQLALIAGQLGDDAGARLYAQRAVAIDSARSRGP